MCFELKDEEAERMSVTTDPVNESAELTPSYHHRTSVEIAAAVCSVGGWDRGRAV